MIKVIKILIEDKNWNDYYTDELKNSKPTEYVIKAEIYINSIKTKIENIPIPLSIASEIVRLIQSCAFTQLNEGLAGAQIQLENQGQALL